MIVYIDSSVLLRIIAGEPGALREWRKVTRPIASVLVRVECLRTIDRARAQGRLDDEEVAGRRAAVLEQLDAFELLGLDAPILDRAAESFPTPVGSLDALHLATAVFARKRHPELVLATHDRDLAMAARALGFRAIGAPAR